MRRALSLLGAVLALGLLLGALLPQGLLALGDRTRDQALRQPQLLDRLAGLQAARQRYRLARLSPPWANEVDHAEAELDHQLSLAFEEHRRDLSAGLAGVRAHLRWLEDLAAGGDPAIADAARQHLLRALVSYGRLDQARALGADPRRPGAPEWLALAAVQDGELEGLEFQLPDSPGLALWLDQPPPAGDGALTRLLDAERIRRQGDPRRAREELAPLLRLDQDLAPAAATAWGLSLLDEAVAEPPGLSLAEVAHLGLDAEAVDRLHAILLSSPADDPAWAGAWLTRAELAFRAGDAPTGLDAARAAVQAARSSWGAPAERLPALARPDAVGALHPERVQRVRVAVDGLRVDASSSTPGAPSPEAAAELRQTVVALLLLQGQAQLAARNLPAAEGLFDRALRLAPSSPEALAWSALRDLLADQPELARGRLQALPEDADHCRAVLQGWLSPTGDWHGPPAGTLRRHLAEPWPPGPPLAWARAHRDRPGELWLALSSPPLVDQDLADPSTALAQAWLWLRVARDLDIGRQVELAEARVERLRGLVLGEPLWPLFAMGAFRVQGPQLLDEPYAGGLGAHSPPGDPNHPPQPRAPRAEQR